MYFQVFREGQVAGICSACGGYVFTGDLAYRIDGVTVCADCVLCGEYIAEAAEDGGQETGWKAGVEVNMKNGGAS